MSGSRTWREYISDTGLRYSIEVDKSNSNLISSFSQVILCPERTSNLAPMPIGLKPRRVHCFAQNNPKVKRNFIVGNPEYFTSRVARGEEFIINATPGNDSISVTYWVSTGYTGEKFTTPIFYGNPDTGLIDGTTDMIF